MNQMTAIENGYKRDKLAYTRAKILQVGDVVVIDGKEHRCDKMENWYKESFLTGEIDWHVQCSFIPTETLKRGHFPVDLEAAGRLTLEEFEKRCAENPEENYNKTVKELLV